MIKRTSIVNNTKVRSVSLSSVVQIGDSVQITPVSWALAVQRQLQLFYGNEGNFAAFPIFTREIPSLPLINSVNIQRYNASNFIKVGNIDITGVSSASVYHIGSTSYIQAETRIKHIRQLQQIRTEN